MDERPLEIGEAAMADDNLELQDSFNVVAAATQSLKERIEVLAEETLVADENLTLQESVEEVAAATESLKERIELLSKETLELQKVIIERFPDSVVVTNDQGIITHVNQQTEYMFGYHHSEMVGKKVEMLLPEPVRPLHEHHRATYADDPRVRRMGTDLRLLGRRKNGTEFPVEIMLSPIVTVMGSYVVAVIRRKR
jgi:PAS domain S-box-containing protein